MGGLQRRARGVVVGGLRGAARPAQPPAPPLPPRSPLCTQHARAEAHRHVLEAAKARLLARLDSAGPAELLALLGASFPFVGLPARGEGGGGEGWGVGGAWGGVGGGMAA